MAASDSIQRAERRPPTDKATGSNNQFLRGIARAFAGSLIFSLPMLMTMEMWWMGFTMSAWRIAILLVVTVPLLLGLSLFAGFRSARSICDNIADVFVAIFVAVIAAIVTLWLFGVLEASMSLREVVGKVAVQMVPGSIGAMLARSQLGESSAEDEAGSGEEPYWGELFIMAVGAIFLSFNVAPTEEMVLIAYKMSVWQELCLALLSLLLMHAFVYSSNFKGGSSMGEEGFIRIFLRYSIVGYVTVIVVSMAILWFFGRADGTGMEEFLSASIVLAFPGSIGAAAARLVL
ncbi:MAG TPA: TIGR02587 family membrane protein [Pseudorhizobium sp.]|jgi:putative integral membrane protein (TIGR02587 family)|nr:TIGR02587 family membrane protein [Pseudorhizobium sp.]